MCGFDGRSRSLLSYVDVEAGICPGHPLRQIREIANTALSALVNSPRAL